VTTGWLPLNNCNLCNVFVTWRTLDVVLCDVTNCFRLTSEFGAGIPFVTSVACVGLRGIEVIHNYLLHFFSTEQLDLQTNKPHLYSRQQSVSVDTGYHVFQGATCFCPYHTYICTLGQMNPWQEWSSTTIWSYHEWTVFCDFIL